MRDEEVARRITLKPIATVAEKALGLDTNQIIPYGHHKAKIALDVAHSACEQPRGKLILVTALNPTPAGEGKTTTSIGLSDGLNRIGVRAAACLREPSLGPCFGMKGGATGGGHAQIAPMQDINLHFNGDIHAVTSANNLLASMVDNHFYWGNRLRLDPARISWRRAMDLNERVLRKLSLNLRRELSREGAFDITAASEVMAVLCLASDLVDLEKRLGDIVVGRASDGSLVHARDLEVESAMTALLVDALAPNLVQTLEHNPAIIHGGPFANIAHGCNSVLATRTALGLADVVVTEAGFGADLGAEKFFNIKCRQSGLRPSACVIVATVRALKMHGGVALEDLGSADVAAVSRGLANLRRHVRNLQGFGVSPVVAVNHFTGDSDEEIEAIRAGLQDLGVKVVLARHWAEGGAGATELAEAVMERIEHATGDVTLSYEDEAPLVDKIRAVATRIYGAGDVQFDEQSAHDLQALEVSGYGHLPVCIAKTQYSFSADPSAKGAPDGHVLPVRGVRLSAGAGFVVVLCGDIMTMPGLPREPAAKSIGVDAKGNIYGL